MRRRGVNIPVGRGNNIPSAHRRQLLRKCVRKRRRHGVIVVVVKRRGISEGKAAGQGENIILSTDNGHKLKVRLIPSKVSLSLQGDVCTAGKVHHNVLSVLVLEYFILGVTDARAPPIGGHGYAHGKDNVAVNRRLLAIREGNGHLHIVNKLRSNGGCRTEVVILCRILKGGNPDAVAIFIGVGKEGIRLRLIDKVLTARVGVAVGSDVMDAEARPSARINRRVDKVGPIRNTRRETLVA